MSKGKICVCPFKIEERSIKYRDGCHTAFFSIECSRNNTLSLAARLLLRTERVLFPRKFSSTVHRCTLKLVVAYFLACTEHLALEPCHNKTSAALPRRCSLAVAKQKCFAAERRAIKGTEPSVDKLSNVSPD